MSQGATTKPALQPHQQVWLAREIAKGHGLYIVEVTEKGHAAWVVYRRGTNGSDSIRLFRASNAAALLRRVRTTAGVTA